MHTFSKAEFPTDAPLQEVRRGTPLIDVVADTAGSKSEFGRLISEGAIFDHKTQTKVSDRKAVVDRDLDLRVGKHRFMRIKVL